MIARETIVETWGCLSFPTFLLIFYMPTLTVEGLISLNVLMKVSVMQSILCQRRHISSVCKKLVENSEPDPACLMARRRFSKFSKLPQRNSSVMFTTSSNSICLRASLTPVYLQLMEISYSEFLATESYTHGV
jgi:hypothetical protein